MVKYFTNSKLLQICREKQEAVRQNDRNSVNINIFIKTITTNDG